MRSNRQIRTSSGEPVVQATSLKGGRWSVLGASLVGCARGGLVLWIAAVATAWVTTNLILLPTIVLLGSFLVPVTGVTWHLDHDPSPALSPRRVIAAFIIAGVIGALAASLLEFWLVLGPGPIGFLKVGLIEEFVKGAAIVLFALGLRSYTTRDGIVLGATVWVWLRRAREQRLGAGCALRRPGRSSLSLIDLSRLDRARSRRARPVWSRSVFSDSRWGDLP